MKSLRRTTRYEALKQAIRPCAASFAIAEAPDAGSPPALANLDEYLVQAIWHEQILQPDRLSTVSGLRVKVIDPGQWNQERGPDFRMAELEIDDRRIRGDVEIHLDAADWERHRHDHDFDYNGVILHVALFNQQGRAFDMLHNGRRIERLILEPALEPDLDTIRQTLANEDFLYVDRTPETGSQCHLAIGRLEPGILAEFFDEAARERMESRIARMETQSAVESPEQALYQAIMTAMGYKGGKTLFFLLAKRAPIAEIRHCLAGTRPLDLPTAIESVLLNVAGLIPPDVGPALSQSDLVEVAANETGKSQTENQNRPDLTDVETEAYLESIRRCWKHSGRHFSDRMIPPTRRWFSCVRPVNFPTRRISGIARVIAPAIQSGSLVTLFIDGVRQSMERHPKSSRDFRREIRALATLLTPLDSSYWTWHYTFKSRRSERPMLLIGEDRAESVFFNAVIPILILHARTHEIPELEQYLWRIHDNYPSLAENAVTRYMRTRLFPDAVLPAGLTFRFERHNQALFQIFYDCCHNASLTEESCIFRKASQNYPPGPLE